MTVPKPIDLDAAKLGERERHPKSIAFSLGAWLSTMRACPDCDVRQDEPGHYQHEIDCGLLTDVNDLAEFLGVRRIGGYTPEPEVMPTACRRCIECEGEEHHWTEPELVNGVVTFVCKHCAHESEAVECVECNLLMPNEVVNDRGVCRPCIDVVDDS